MDKYKYLIIVNRVEPGLGWEAQIRETTGITNDFKKAYNVGLFLARISKPALGYRKALETIKVNGAVNFGQMEGDQEVTIVKCKWY